MGDLFRVFARAENPIKRPNVNFRVPLTTVLCVFVNQI